MYLTQKSRLAVALLLSALFAQISLADEVSDQFALGTNFYQQSRWPEAADAFGEFFQKYPNHPKASAAMFYRAEALVQGKQYAVAHEAFAAFMKMFPEHRFARQSLYRTGEMAHLIGRRAEAREALNKFCVTYTSDPILAYALPYLGEIEFRDGNYALAESRYLMALDAFPKGPMAGASRFGLARALQSQDKFDEAIPLFEALYEKSQSSFADDAKFQICLIYHQQCKYDKAVAGLSEFLTKFDDSPLRINATYWLGMAHAARGDWQEAARVLKIATLQAEDHELAAAIHFGAGEAFRQIQQDDVATTYYQSVSSNWPRSQWCDDSLDVLTQIAFKAGDHVRVESLVASFINQFADSPLRFSVQCTHGRSMLAQKSYARAIELFESIQTRFSDLSEDDATSLQYLLGVAYAGENQFQKSIDALSSIVGSEDDVQFAASVAIARATAYFGLKDDVQAVGSQRRYLELLPSGPDAAKCRAELAISLVRLKRYPESLAACRELQNKHPDYGGLLQTAYFLAERAYSSDQRAMAEELFTWLAREGSPPEYVQKGLYGLAWLRSDENDTVKTAEAFQLLLDRFPNSDLAHEASMMRARALQKSGKLNEAFDAFLSLIDNFPLSKHVPGAMLAAAKIKATSPSATDKTASVELLEQFEEQFPDHEQADAALYDLAWTLLDLKRDQDANQAFKRLYTKFPSSRFWGDVTYRLAEQAAHTGDRETAQTLTAQLIEAETSDEIRCHALYLNGQLAADSGDWQRVTETMDQIVTHHADSSLHLPAEYWVAESFFRRGEFGEAQKQFLALNKKTVGRNDSWLAMVPLRLAQTYAKEKKWQKAYEASFTIAELFPDFHQQYEADYLIGRCLASKAKFTEARAAYERAVRSTTGGRTETAAMAQWMIGETYFHQKRYDDAIKAYHRVETLYGYPQWQAAALLQAGKCYEKKDDFESAIKVYAQLLKNYSEASSANEASQRLRVVKDKLAAVSR